MNTNQPFARRNRNADAVGVGILGVAERIRQKISGDRSMGAKRENKIIKELVAEEKKIIRPNKKNARLRPMVANRRRSYPALLDKLTHPGGGGSDGRSKTVRSAVAAPATSYGTHITGVAPVISNSGDITTVTRRELVGTICGSTAWQMSSQYSVNPGLGQVVAGTPSGFAPWAASFAKNFIEWTLEEGLFEFVPDVNTSVSGNIQMAFSPDVTLAPPGSLTEIMDFEGAKMCSVWEHEVLELPKKAPIGGRWKLCRNTAVAGDQHLYDWGTIYLSTSNVPSTEVVGNLFSTYRISFRKPRLNPASFLPRIASQFTTTTESFTTGVTKIVVWTSNTFSTTEFANNATTTIGLDPLQWFPSNASLSGVFTPPAGSYWINFEAECSDNTAEVFTVIAGFQKNSVTDSTSISKGEVSTGVGAQIVQMSANHIMVFNGTDTFNTVLTMTGAGGTLTAIAMRLNVLLV